MRKSVFVLMLSWIVGCSSPPPPPVPSNLQRVMGADLDGPKGDAMQEGKDQP